MEIYIISDTHFGHRRMLTFVKKDGSKLRPWTDIDEMNEYMVDQWNAVVKPNDLVIHLGDVAWSNHLSIMNRLNGTKRLILGNHDNNPITDYQKHFNEIHGCFKMDNMWFSHIPVHDSSMEYGCIANIHGHIHGEIIPDVKYFNASVECIGYRPMPLYQAKEHINFQLKNNNYQLIQDIVLDLI